MPGTHEPVSEEQSENLSVATELLALPYTSEESRSGQIQTERREKRK